MALVVFLKGINVGGYRKFRPSVLAQQLARYDVASVGAAGTFVVRKPVTRTKLRAELVRRLPFDADIVICDGRDVVRLASSEPFAGQPSDRSIVQFVSALSRRPRKSMCLSLTIPDSGDWGLKVFATSGPFIYGIYRRQMKAIGYLGQLDKIFGASATTRSWSTIQAIARILDKS